MAERPLFIPGAFDSWELIQAQELRKKLLMKQDLQQLNADVNDTITWLKNTQAELETLTTAKPPSDTQELGLRVKRLKVRRRVERRDAEWPAGVGCADRADQVCRGRGGGWPSLSSISRLQLAGTWMQIFIFIQKSIYRWTQSPAQCWAGVAQMPNAGKSDFRGTCRLVQRC